MADPIYPSTLPVPQTLRRTPFERRQLSAADRPRDSRPLQFDRGSTEAVTWPPLTSAQFEELMTWWRETLYLGGSWFSSTWPCPQGRPMLVRKFIEQPRRTFVAGGFWRVAATVEVRGVGQVPIGVLPVPDPQVWNLGSFGSFPGGTAPTPYVAAATFLAGGEASWAGSGAPTGIIEEIRVDGVTLDGGPWVSTYDSYLFVIIRRSNGVAYFPDGRRIV